MYVYREVVCVCMCVCSGQVCVCMTDHVWATIRGCVSCDVSRFGVFGACHVVSVDMDVSAMHMFHNVCT